MAGTSAGAKKGAQTLLRTRGKEFFIKRASRAGSRGKNQGVVKGFAANPELASAAGKKGKRTRK